MAGKTWTTDPKAELQPNLAETGLAANAPMVLFDFFRQSVKDFGDQPALFFKNISPGGDAASTPFSSYTWNEYYNQCITFAKALISLDFKPHTVSNIMGFNSKEWFISQFGTMAAGGIAAGIYPSNSPDQCQYISHHSEAEVVLLENNVQLEKYFQIANQLPKLKALVVWGEQPAEDTQKRLPGRVQLLHWDAFMQLGASIPDEMVNERIKAQKPGHCAVLVYTSGTTGPPKAVMISHDNATWTTTALAHSFPMDSNDITVSYLPLSHIAAQILDMYAHVYAGSKVYFAQPDALKGTIVQTLKEVRPTKFFGVPRVWEKMREKMLEIGRQNGACKSMIGSWAKDKGSKKTESHQFGGNKSLPLGFGLANKIAFSKVRAGLGLDRARDCFVAAAPISEEVLRYFGSLNIPIYEIFGQSECTGPHTLNTPDAWKIGTIGRPLLGSESRVAEGTGELQYRGRHIMMGYMKNPEATKKTIDDDGWLASGDVVTVDDDNHPDVPSPSGFFKITGRIKELIITSGGENVAPVLIENAIKQCMPAVANAMVVGDKRKYLTVILSLHVEVDGEGTPSEKLAGGALAVCKDIGSAATTVADAREDALWKKYIDDGINAANAMTASRVSQVKKWAIIPTDFSVGGGELTATLKLKRGPTSEKYTTIIEGMYGGN